MKKAGKQNDFKNGKLKNYFCFECLNVKIGIQTESSAVFDKLKESFPSILPIRWRRVARAAEVEHWFTVLGKDLTEGFEIYKESELISGNNPLEESLNFLESRIRSTIAEFTKDFVFLHAGAVSWKGKAIVIPGKSFAGKTTLVAALIKRNCDYLSDEFAVIDKRGFVHPFPKKLSLRGIIDDFLQVDFEVEDLGGKRRRKPVPIGFILVAEYKEKTKRPVIKINSLGEGIMAGVANSFSVRQNPKLVLEVLGVVAARATMLQSTRGEAEEFADFFLDYLEKMEKMEKMEKPEIFGEDRKI